MPGGNGDQCVYQCNGSVYVLIEDHSPPGYFCPPTAGVCGSAGDIRKKAAEPIVDGQQTDATAGGDTDSSS
jgi:hypothetical protein